jgi:hypothetical protein
MFNKEGVVYLHTPKIIFNDNWILDLDKIAELKQHNLVIIDFSSEHYGADGLDYVYHALDNSTINFLMLVHDPADHLTYPRMLHYPYWYNTALKKFILPESIATNRKFLWSCQNGNPRPHRIYNFLYAINHGWIHKGLFTMYNVDFANEPTRADDYPLDQKLSEQWAQLRQNLPHRNTLSDIMQEEVTGPVFTDAYVNLVTEVTVTSKIFMSEKTWKPILAQQLFLIFGNPGTVDALRSMGVDTYDDIVDHSYDEEPNWQLRLEKIYKSLQKLESINWPKIYQQTADRRLKNFKLCVSGQFSQIYNDMLRAKINSFVK